VFESLPIGVFDSGLGGLTVLKELHAALPNEDFVYLGDNARLPYGSKSPEIVSRYAKNCVDFLIRKKVKRIVIACNTASAAALSTLTRESLVPIHGVISAGVTAAIEADSNPRVLVMATTATVKSEAYLAEFHRQSPDVKVEQLACPLLAPLAEEGWFDHPLTDRIIETYLNRVRNPFNVVLLGCTHYPLLEASLRRVLPPETKLIHSGTTVARQVRDILERTETLNPEGRQGSLKFYSTDHVPAALPVVESLFGRSAQFELAEL